MLLIQAQNDRLISFPEIDFILVQLDQFQEVLNRSKYQKAIAPLVTRLERQLKALFNRQKNTVIDQFDALQKYFKEDKINKDFDDLLDDALEGVNSLKSDGTLAIDNVVSQALTLGGKNLIDDLGLGISFNLKNPKAVAYLKQYGTTLIKGINEETRNQLHTILNNAIENGYSYSKTVSLMRAKFDEFSVARAKRIAVTELGNAYQEGSLQAVKLAQDSGLSFEKFWATVGDNRVSDECQANQDAGWIAADDTFPSGSDRPLEHPNCRCVLLLRRAK